MFEAGAGAWIVKRAPSTDYRPGVRPRYRDIEPGPEIPTVVKDLSSKLGTPDSIRLTLRQAETYDPEPSNDSRRLSLDSGFGRQEARAPE
jgi:hypothetical protein